MGDRSEQMMTTVSQAIADAHVQPGSVMAWWLSGTGFVYQNASRTQIYIDRTSPTASPRSSASSGLARPRFRSRTQGPIWSSPPLIGMRTISIRRGGPRSWPAARRPNFWSRPPAARGCWAGGCPGRASRLSAWARPRSSTTSRITAVPARHESGIPGWEVPDAIGLLIEAEGLRIYHTGDTEYDLRLGARLRQKPAHRRDDDGHQRGGRKHERA